MSDDLKPILTRVGLAALRNAQGTGVAAAFAGVAIGRGVAGGGGGFVGYAPSAGQTALYNQVASVPLLQGIRIGAAAGSDPIGFRVLAEVPPLATGTAPIAVNELAWCLTDGTPLCIWSDPAFPLGFLTDKATLQLAHELYLTQVPLAFLNITVLRPDIPDLLAALYRRLGAGQRALRDKADAFVRQFS